MEVVVVNLFWRCVDTVRNLVVFQNYRSRCFVSISKIMNSKIDDASAKQIFLRLLVERMQQNPNPSNAPKFTRDMLHERHDRL
jgi:hypothetical protein